MRTRSTPGTGGEWLVTFADLVTLLFIFFVLLTTLSTRPKNCNGIRLYMQDHKENFTNYELRSNKLSCIISLPQDFLFESGGAELTSKALKELYPFFKMIRQLEEHQDDLVIVEGHTDNIPINTKKFRSNWELSSARSTNVATFLIQKVNYLPELVSITAYADTRPKIKYKDLSGASLKGDALRHAREVNRRVEIVLIDNPGPRAKDKLIFGTTSE